MDREATFPLSFFQYCLQLLFSPVYDLCDFSFYRVNHFPCGFLRGSTAGKSHERLAWWDFRVSVCLDRFSLRRCLPLQHEVVP
jgi:hypothetical protein